MSNKIIRCDYQFQCPLKWDDLQKLENAKIRFCDVCQKDVHFAHNQNEFDDLAKKGNCVAIKTLVAGNEVLSVTNNKVCKVCKTPISEISRFCLNCGNQTIKLPDFPPDFPQVTMGLPALPPEIIKIPENSPPKKKKPWWKPWE